MTRRSHHVESITFLGHDGRTPSATCQCGQVFSRATDEDLALDFRAHCLGPRGKPGPKPGSHRAEPKVDQP
jgi:hypothetical protein